MTSINPELIKNCFNLYETQSLYSNYSKIANKYYILYKENKDKKYSADNQDKLREDVKKWLFNQTLENRMKICTVENEFYGKILYQMLLYNKMDKTMLFKPKPNFFLDTEDNNGQFTNNLGILENEINYPQNNSNIKITKTNKAGKKTDAPKLGYSQSCLKDFKNEEILANNFGNYFTFQSVRENISGSNIQENRKIIELSIEDFFNNIIFFSVHHRYFPDCFTLSPEFLLEKEKFDNYFKVLGHQKYFCSLIQSQPISGNIKSQKQYLYMMPDWLQNNNNNECMYSASQYTIAFFEQVIMVKYLLNKNDKKLKIYSLLDEQSLNRFFTDRKLAINYMKKNYNNENKINILNQLEIEKYYNNLIANNEKMKYVKYFESFRKKVHAEKLKNNPYIIIDNITNNPHSNKFEDKYNKMKNIQKPKNNKNVFYNNGEVTLEQIYSKLSNILQNNDIINFIDCLLFQNYNFIWKTEFFLQSELFEKISNLIMEQNCKELIYDSKITKSIKSKHKKKNKKNNKINNNTDNSLISKVKKEEEKNNIEEKEYEGIFKDEEDKLLYAPYYLKANTEQRMMYIKEKMKQFISKEIILGIILDNVFLTPLNSGLDVYEELKNDNIINNNKNEEKKNDKKEKIIIKGNEIINNSINIIEEKMGLINNKNIIEEQTERKKQNINGNNSNDIEIDDYGNNNKEKMNNNILKENDFEINDSLSLKSDNVSSEIDKTTITTNSTNPNEPAEHYNDSNKINDDNNNNINNIINTNNSKPKKKKEKEQTFFLFDTIKKKKKKIINNFNNNGLISNEFSIIANKEQNRRLSFYEKLHNDIIKYETKVVTLLNHSMKFKDYCIKEVKRIIQESFSFSKDYNIDIYGSYATGLMIEASDIDIKIKLNGGNKEDLDKFFEALFKKLENENKFDKIIPISTASVPVIKLVLTSEKFIKGNDYLENSFKQFKELSLFKHYIFDINELLTIKIDVTFILIDKNTKINNIANNEINELNEKDLNKNNINNNNIKIINNKIKDNEATAHDHDKSIGGEISSVLYVKEQIIKYPEVKYILRVLKRYFYYKKMNSSFLGGLSSYNLFLLLLSYAKYSKMYLNSEQEIIKISDEKNKSNINLGFFLFKFLEFFKDLDFKQSIIDINSPNIYIYDMIIPEKSKEFNFGKSIVIIDPLTGVNASKSSYKIEEIQNTFSEAYDFFYNEKIKYDKEGKTKIIKNNNKDILIGLPIYNKNDNNHGGGNFIEKFLGK